MYIQSLMVSKLQESMEWHGSYSTFDINISLTPSIADIANKFALMMLKDQAKQMTRMFGLSM